MMVNKVKIVLGPGARFLVVMALLFGLGLFKTTKRISAQAGTDYIFDIREIETAEIGVASPVGLAFSPQSGLFQIMDSTSNGANNPTLISMTMSEDPAGTATIQDNFSNPLNLAFNGKSNSLYHLNQGANSLDQIPADASGKLPPSAAVSARYSIKAYGLQNSEGMTFNPADGRLYLLDPAGKRMVRVTPDASGGYDGDSAAAEGRIERIDLKHLGAQHLRGIAFNPATGNLYVLGVNEKKLFEITETGSLVNTLDVSPFLLRDPQAITFAPSGDSTDDPAIQDLYIADSGQSTGANTGTGGILELSLTAPIVQDAVAVSTNISLVEPTILTSQWNPPSPDASSLEYSTRAGRLIMTDSEVDEMSIWQGANVFDTTTSGNLVATCNVLSFSKEPAGIAENPDNKHLFLTDDGKALLFEINVGADDTYCTSDDSRTTIDTFLTYNDDDPEGAAFGQGKLIITDGVAAEVYVIDPGPNGTFGNSDDQVTHFDTSVMGLRDPEGIGYNPERGTIFIAGRGDKVLVETSFSGTVLNVFDISPFNIVVPSGVAAGPGSQDPLSTNIYISARGVDNNNDPNENDGKIYEFTLGGSTPPSQTPTPTATATNPPTGQPLRYLSLANTGSYTVGSVAGVRDEDILSFDGANFAMVFDGSDVGVGGVDLDAFEFVDSDTLLMSFGSAVTINSLVVDDWDIVQFDATSLGSTTAGSFSLYFDGNNFGLDTSAEDIDAIDVLSDNTILISTTGNPSVVSGARDEDILAFTPTTGTWTMYFDGTDVGLADSAEDTDAVAVSNGNLYLSTTGSFAVNGVSGENVDVFVCAPTSLGDTTACNFSLYFDGSAYGLTGNNLDAFEVP